MRAEDTADSSGALGWIRKNFIGLLVAAVGLLAADKLTDMGRKLEEVGKKIEKAADEIGTITGTLRVYENRIASVEKRVDRMEVNYLPWQRVPSREPSPGEPVPDMPRHGVPADQRRFN